MQLRALVAFYSFPFWLTHPRVIAIAARQGITFPPYSSDQVTIRQLARTAGVTVAVMRRGIGPINEQLRDRHNARMGYPCLLSLELIHVMVDERCGPRMTADAYYSLTQRGIAVAAKIDLATLPKRPRPGRKGKPR